jgi:hypothetical protein
MPPVTTALPSRDLWPLVVQRREDGRRWSWLDVALALGVAAILVARPELLLLLAYHF